MKNISFSKGILVILTLLTVFGLFATPASAYNMVCTPKPGGGEKCVSTETLPSGKPEHTTESFPGGDDDGSDGDVSGGGDDGGDGDDGSSFSSAPSSGPKYVIVTEEIPGAKCSCVAGLGADLMGPVAPGACGNPQTRKYSCEVKPGLEGFQDVFAQIVRWFVYISMLLGVIAIIGAGVLWAFGSESEEYTKKAKGWVVNIFIGLLLLFTFRYILGFLAPWIYG